MPKRKRADKDNFDLRKKILKNENLYNRLDGINDILVKIEKIFLSRSNSKGKSRAIKNEINRISINFLLENELRVTPELSSIKLKNEWLKTQLDNFQKMIKQGKEPDFNSFKDDCEKNFKLINVKISKWKLDNTINSDLVNENSEIEEVKEELCESGYAENDLVEQEQQIAVKHVVEAQESF